MRIPNLHAKYLAIRSEHSLKLKALYIQRKQLVRDLSEYYRGEKNNPQELREIGKEPWELKTLKSDLLSYVEADDLMMNIEKKIAMEKEIVGVVDEIMRAVNNRGFQIQAAIKWRALSQFGLS